MVKLETRTAATAQDLTTAIFEVKPQIIHFAGHGTGNGELCFETPTGETFPVEPSAFAGLLEELNDNVQCVVLNACHSRKPALAIEQHVPFVVGMNAAISDEAAIVFAGEFYQALAYGRPIPKAFKIAVAALEVLKIPGADIPQLIHQAPK
jgi:CHAT domain-containing protein